MCGQSVLDKVFVDKVCVDKVWRRAEEEKAEEEPGIQNQKQEPHTKMWGINHPFGNGLYHLFMVKGEWFLFYQHCS